MYNHQPYDAIEVVSGYYPYEEVAKGKKIPIVGVSDAHGCFKELFGWFYTVYFAKTNSKDDIISSIKDGYSVAIENIPGEALRPIGPLVKFTLYLNREYVPLHDEICEEEGLLMIDLVKGKGDALYHLAKHKGKVDQLINKIYNRSGVVYVK